MDAITMLKNDHTTVEKLFKQFEEAGDRAHVRKRGLVDRIIEELVVHSSVEEQLFYPVTRDLVPDTETHVLENLEEHHVVEWILDELSSMAPTDERFDAKVHVLMANVRHHVEEEEGEYFHTVREALGRKALGELGERMEAAKAVAPTHPQPTSPDTAPANMVTGTGAGIVDRLGDTVSGLAQGSVSAAGDIVDRALGRQPRRPAPTGTSTARSTAASVREGANDALDRAIEAVRNAHDTGENVTTAAASAGRSTAKTAETGAKTTAGTARSAVERSEKAAETAVKRTTGTAKQASKAAATSTKQAAKRTTGTARQAAKSASKTASTTTKQTAGTARKAASDTAKSARKGAKKVASAAESS